MKVESLSFFFPAYNEETNVEKMLEAGLRILPEVAETWEIIPVNDGSRDKTKEILEKWAKERPEIRPIHHETNQGYGAALISGFRASRFEWIFFTDGDRQFDLREITLLLEQRGEGDLILGYRKNRRDPLHRKINAWLWGFLVKNLFGFRVRDVDCAFKLIHRKVLENIELTAKGAMVSTELLARAHRRGFRFIEVGVTHHPRQAGTQTGANLKVILRAFQELFKLYRKIKKETPAP